MLSIESADKVIVNDLYIEYATWFLELVNREKGLRGVWCVDKNAELIHEAEDSISSLPPDLLRTPQTCWPDLERIRLEGIDCNGFAAGKVQEWRNVVVLQIVECPNLTSINLHGLTCLRHLELRRLGSLNSLMFTRDDRSTSDVSLGTCPEFEQGLCMLKFVSIVRLQKLECLPSFNRCTSLKFLLVKKCESLTQPPSVQGCRGLERMDLHWQPKQTALPSLCGLTSLRDLTIRNVDCGLFFVPALELEGLGSLISLRALELGAIPVCHLAGLENLTHLEYIRLKGLSHLKSFPSLVNVKTSPLHVLDVDDCFNIKEDQKVLKSKRLIQLKLDDLARRGKVVPHTPHKISRESEVR